VGLNCFHELTDTTKSYYRLTAGQAEMLSVLTLQKHCTDIWSETFNANNPNQTSVKKKVIAVD